MSVQSTLTTDILLSLWFILPAYVANASPVLLGGGTPIDLGKKFFDGRRIFGDGKTIRGFISGIFCGFLVGLLQVFVNPTLEKLIEQHVTLLPYQRSLLRTNFIIAILLPMGAMVGDLIGSFIKRRLGLERGAPAPLLDQLDFLIGALLFTSFVFTVPFICVTILLVVTLIIHLLTNALGYILGLKNVPW